VPLAGPFAVAGAVGLGGAFVARADPLAVGVGGAFIEDGPGVAIARRKPERAA
jgi:hypothetical protein